MKTVFATMLALGLLAGTASASTPFDRINDAAPHSVFTDIQNSAPRSVFDKLNDNAPHAPFDQVQDTAARSDFIPQTYSGNGP